MLRRWPINLLDGTALTTGNVVAQDGAAATTVATGTGGSATASADAPHSGTGAKLAGGSGTSGGNCILRLPLASAAAAAAVQVWWSNQGAPAVDEEIVNGRHGSGVVWRLVHRYTGALQVQTAGRAALWTSAIVPSGLLRLEAWAVTAAASSAAHLGIYLGDHASPVEAWTGTGVDLGSNPLTAVDVGRISATIGAARTVLVDDIAVDDGRASEIGPPAGARSRLRPLPSRIG